MKRLLKPKSRNSKSNKNTKRSSSKNKSPYYCSPFRSIRSKNSQKPSIISNKSDNNNINNININSNNNNRNYLY